MRHDLLYEFDKKSTAAAASRNDCQVYGDDEIERKHIGLRDGRRMETSAGPMDQIISDSVSDALPYWQGGREEIWKRRIAPYPQSPTAERTRLVFLNNTFKNIRG
ncbi:hypothetical protein TNCV_3778941 [Trichonephila clavipes]|nr:hypothetical protein TNCV_3778941 [Trichonephila clavipes]